MKTSRRFLRLRLPVALAATGLLLLASPAAAGPGHDPAKIVGAAECSECHTDEAGVWKETPHFQTFQALHRRPEAKAIAQKMELRSIKRGDVCLDCHYTTQTQGSRTKPVSGVSCESCHGAAADWIQQHNDYGGPDVKKADESPAHRKERIQKSMAAGMLHPSNLYLVAQNCYSCHTVPNEKLVNVGGHQSGSEDFELVAWSQGKVRHDFQANGNGHSPAEHLRVMYVVGSLVDLEYSLRAAAGATEAGAYADATAARVGSAVSRLEAIQAKTSSGAVQKALAAAGGVQARPGNAGSLNAAADQVGAIARGFAESANGANGLAGVDALLPDQSQYK